MRDDQFEWHHEKAEQNRRKHGITFEMARDVFNDYFFVAWEDASQDQGEDRHVILGMVENRLLFVAFTQRGDRFRIISARLAEPFERRRYFNENQT